MTWLRDTLNNKGARAKCLKWAYFALATSLHVLAKVTISKNRQNRQKLKIWIFEIKLKLFNGLYKNSGPGDLFILVLITYPEIFMMIGQQM